MKREKMHLRTTNLSDLHVVCLVYLVANKGVTDLRTGLVSRLNHMQRHIQMFLLRVRFVNVLKNLLISRLVDCAAAA